MPHGRPVSERLPHSWRLSQPGSGMRHNRQRLSLAWRSPPAAGACPAQRHPWHDQSPAAPVPGEWPDDRWDRWKKPGAGRRFLPEQPSISAGAAVPCRIVPPASAPLCQRQLVSRQGSALRRSRLLRTWRSSLGAHTGLAGAWWIAHCAVPPPCAGRPQYVPAGRHRYLLP